MTQKMKMCLIFVLVAVSASVFFYVNVKFVAGGTQRDDGEMPKRAQKAEGRKKQRVSFREKENPLSVEQENSDITLSSEREQNEKPLTEEERAEQEEEKQVEAFDALTDKWMEPSEKGVSMEDVAAFSEAFKRVPKARRDECIHRALNLVPDENVMLLAGVLMDKTVEKEIVEAVFNDVLNRDESVKKPIMQQIFKDKTHPCWADVAWILDVTGELPEKK